MAEEIILEINVGNSVTRIAELRQSMDQLIAQREELSEKSKAGDLEATKALEQLNSTVRNTQQEYKSQQRILDGYNASVKANVNTSNLAANSIQQNRDLLKQLTAQYKDMRNPTANATAQIKHLSDVLKQQEAAIGNTSRNVGNYKESFKDAFSTIASGIPALGGFKTAQLGINAAMNANPAGALVLLLQSLYEIFKQNAEVADQVSFAIDGVTKAIGSVVDGIVDTITNFDKFAAALQNPVKFLFNLGKNAAIAAEEGYKAAKAIDSLSESSAIANAEIGKNNVLIEKNTNILKTRTASINERKAAAKEIADLERINAQESIKIAQDELQAEQLRLKNKTKTGAESAKLIELQGKLDAATLQSQTINEGYNRRISQLLQKEGAERDALTKQVEKANESILKADTEMFKNRLKYAAEIDDARNKSESDRIAALSKAFNEENSFLQKQQELDLKTVDLSVANEKEKARRKEEIQINYLERQLDLAIQFLGANGSITKAELQSIETIKLSLEAARHSATTKPDGQPTYFESLGIDKSALDIAAQTLNGFSQIVSGINNLVTAGYELRLQEIQGEQDAEVAAIENSSLAKEDKEKKIAEINKKAAQDKYQLELEAFNTSKAIQIVQAIIGTALGVVNGLNAGLSLGPAGVVMGPLLAALAGATGAVQIGLIASQKPPPPPKLAEGGRVIDIDGMPHSAGGTPIHVNGRLVAEAERDEGLFIMKKTAYQNIDKLSGWNQLYGGDSWNKKTSFAALGGTINIPTGDGGFAAREVARSVDNSLNAQTMENILKRLPVPRLDIGEFEEKQNSRNRSIDISEA